jgi:hypothetical protein
MVLSDPGNFDPHNEYEVPLLNLWAWLLFAIVNNWFLVEDQLISTRQPIKTDYFVRLCLYDTLVLLLAFLISWTQKAGDYSGILFYLAAVFWFLAWAVALAWLYRHGKPQFGPKTTKILDRLLIDVWPDLLIRKKSAAARPAKR